MASNCCCCNKKDGLVSHVHINDKKLLAYARLASDYTENDWFCKRCVKRYVYNLQKFLQFEESNHCASNDLVSYNESLLTASSNSQESTIRPEPQPLRTRLEQPNLSLEHMQEMIAESYDKYFEPNGTRRLLRNSSSSSTTPNASSSTSSNASQSTAPNASQSTAPSASQSTASNASSSTAVSASPSAENVSQGDAPVQKRPGPLSKTLPKAPTTDKIIPLSLLTTKAHAQELLTQPQSEHAGNMTQDDAPVQKRPGPLSKTLSKAPTTDKIIPLSPLTSNAHAQELLSQPQSEHAGNITQGDAPVQNRPGPLSKTLPKAPTTDKIIPLSPLTTNAHAQELLSQPQSEHARIELEGIEDSFDRLVDESPPPAERIAPESNRSLRQQSITPPIGVIAIQNNERIQPNQTPIRNVVNRRAERVRPSPTAIGNIAKRRAVDILTTSDEEDTVPLHMIKQPRHRVRNTSPPRAASNLHWPVNDTRRLTAG